IPPAYAGGTDCANSSLASHSLVVPALRPHPNPLPEGEGGRDLSLRLAIKGSVPSRLLMTGSALLRRWSCRFRLNLSRRVVTIATSMMEGLLIVHSCRFRGAFKLHGRNFRQELWLFTSPSMTVCTFCAQRIRILRQQFQRQRGSSIGRPGSLVRWMLGSFRCRLGSVMTINTGDWFR